DRRVPPVGCRRRWPRGRACGGGSGSRRRRSGDRGDGRHRPRCLEGGPPMILEIVGVDSTPGLRSVDAGFLHGYACSARDWVPVAERLDGDHLLVDLPGHGSRASSAPAGFASLVDGVAALLAALDRPAVLVGHSMGGMVAVAVAAAHPGLLRGVVLADAFP